MSNNEANSKGVLNLLENGLDFIMKGLDELFGQDRMLINVEATRIDTRNYKYGITNLFAGFLLVLKERLSKHMPELIYIGTIKDVRQKLRSGKQIPNTVDLDEALERLEIGPRVVFTEEELAIIKRIQNFRNQFEHFKVDINKHQVQAEVTKFLDIIETFLKTQLNINLDRYSPTSAALRKRVVRIREEVIKFDSKLEETVYETITLIAGRRIPGDLLSSQDEIVLPQLKKLNHTSSLLSRFHYIPDFEGKFEDAQWFVEIKGGYARGGYQTVIEKLIDIHKTIGAKTWLIAFGEFTEGEKNLAVKNGVYLTDPLSWKEILKISKA